jgi:hypothetical protein
MTGVIARRIALIGGIIAIAAPFCPLVRPHISEEQRRWQPVNGIVLSYSLLEMLSLGDNQWSYGNGGSDADNESLWQRSILPNMDQIDAILFGHGVLLLVLGSLSILLCRIGVSPGILLVPSTVSLAVSTACLVRTLLVTERFDAWEPMWGWIVLITGGVVLVVGSLAARRDLGRGSSSQLAAVK